MFGLTTANITPFKPELATLIFTENMKGQLNSSPLKMYLKTSFIKQKQGKP